MKISSKIRKLFRTGKDCVRIVKEELLEHDALAWFRPQHWKRVRSVGEALDVGRGGIFSSVHDAFDSIRRPK